MPAGCPIVAAMLHAGGGGYPAGRWAGAAAGCGGAGGAEAAGRWGREQERPACSREGGQGGGGCHGGLAL